MVASGATGQDKTGNTGYLGTSSKYDPGLQDANRSLCSLRAHGVLLGLRIWLYVVQNT